MEIFVANPWAAIFIFVPGIIGLFLCWLGAMFACVTAFGNKKHVWGVFIALTGPILGIPYTFTSEEAEYPRKIMVIGLIIMTPTLLYLLALSLGLD